MSKKIFLYLLFLLSQQVLFSHDNRPVHPTKNIFSVVNEDGRKRIDRVNRRLIDYYIPTIERALGRIPYDVRPRSFKVGVNFYSEGLRILKYIEMLEKNEKLKPCSECLAHIDEIFYVQFRLLIRKLKIVDFIPQQDWIRLGMKSVAALDSQIHSDASVRAQLLDLFAKIYDPNLRPAILSPSEQFLISTTRRIIIVLFRSRRADELSEPEQRDFLAQTLDAIKKEIDAKQMELSIDGSLAQLLRGSLNVIELVAIEKKSRFPIKKVLIWTGSVVALLGVLWLAVKIVSKLRAEAEVKLPKEAKQWLYQMSGANNPGEKGEFTRAMGVVADKGYIPVGPSEKLVEKVEDLEDKLKKVPSRIEKMMTNGVNRCVNRFVTLGSSAVFGGIGGLLIGGPIGGLGGACVGACSETAFRWLGDKHYYPGYGFEKYEEPE
jgi:hypothetical protein